MGTWKSRGLRGSQLEDLINHTVSVYREKGLAVIQKVPTPITPVEMSENHSQITLAYFRQKSTVDYIGVVQGIPVCFDAKECRSDSWSLRNIHPHQVTFMRDFERQEGVSFIILSFVERGESYYVPFRDLYRFWQRMEEGGRKSFHYDELDQRYLLRAHKDMFVHFLEALQLDLDERQGGDV